jgi:hypothetical protein
VAPALLPAAATPAALAQVALSRSGHSQIRVLAAAEVRLVRLAWGQGMGHTLQQQQQLDRQLQALQHRSLGQAHSWAVAAVCMEQLVVQVLELQQAEAAGQLWEAAAAAA